MDKQNEGKMALYYYIPNMNKKTLYSTYKVKHDPITKEFYQIDYLPEFNINYHLFEIKYKIHTKMKNHQTNPNTQTCFEFCFFSQGSEDYVGFLLYK